MGYGPISRSPMGCASGASSSSSDATDGAEADEAAAPDFIQLIHVAAACDPNETVVGEGTMSSLQHALTDLWRATFGLKSWLVVASDIDGAVRPHIRQEADRGMILAFTDEFTALRHQAERGMTFREGYFTIQLDLDGALATIGALVAAGATDILFNDGNEAFALPIEMLGRVRRHLEHGDDPAALDATTIRVTGDSTPIGPLLKAAAHDKEALPPALDALLALSDWWFLCNPSQPDAFHVRRFALPRDGQGVQEQAVVAFTAHRLAMEATERYGLADEHGSIVLMQMPAADAVQWLQSFIEHGVETVMFDALTTPLALRIAELLEQWRARESASGGADGIEPESSPP